MELFAEVCLKLNNPVIHIPSLDYAVGILITEKSE